MRRLRKHILALLAAATFNFVVFFPVIFMGRVVSPNDVFFNFDPWSFYRPAGVLHVQNATLNDPPTSYLTLVALMKSQPGAFHWNPYIAAGVPGFGSSAAAILSPFILLAAAVPLAWFYTLLIFAKLNVAFLFSYWWLREERLGKRGAAIGALVVAGAGVYAVRWLWQSTNATALYPALLWLVRRAFNRKPAPLLVVTPIAVAYALAGFPSSMAYGAYVAVLYALFIAIRERTLPLRSIATAVAASLLALMIVAPSLVPFLQLVKRTGYLTIREHAAAEVWYPVEHWRLFVDPFHLGSPVYKNWKGNPALARTNNFVEATVYVGLLTIPLALVAMFRRRARTRFFWIALALILLAAMFGLAGLPRVLGMLPGIKYTPMTRLASLLPLPLGYLAAAGAAWLASRIRPRQAFAGTIAVLLAFDLALFAGKFYPYLRVADANVPTTPTIEFLQAERGPYRVAPLLNYFWPNAAEMFHVEDIRSHFSSEADYRRLVQRFEPTSWAGTSTIIQLNSLKLDFSDPLVGMLGVRYYLEHKPIDIVKWTTFGATVPGVKQTGTFGLEPGMVLQRTVNVDAEPFWAIELPIDVTETRGANARLLVELLKDNRVVWSRGFTRADTEVLDKVYLPLRPYARLGESVTMRIRSIGVTGWMLIGENTNANEAKLFYGRVQTPVIFDRELPDGRVFRNLSELPRFRAVSRLRKLNDDEFLRAKDIDFEREAVITDDPVMPPEVSATDARVELVAYAPAEQRLLTNASAPFYLASAEKLTPELAITIDGRNVRPVETDMMFAGVPVPAGRHEVVFSRRIARGWWGIAAAGVGLFVLLSVVELIVGRRRASGQEGTANAERRTQNAE
ncbi:MAG TPA: hypothetical protein VF618_13515 [Thermoanaerobaculia bacterium]